MDIVIQRNGTSQPLHVFFKQIAVQFAEPQGITAVGFVVRDVLQQQACKAVDAVDAVAGFLNRNGCLGYCFLHEAAESDQGESQAGDAEKWHYGRIVLGVCKVKICKNKG